MKRILPLLLILLLALSACSDSTPAVSGTAAATEPVASQTEAAPDTSTQAVELPVVSSTPPAQTEPTEPTEPAALFPRKLLENDACVLSVTDVSMDEIRGFTVMLSCENKTDSAQLFTLVSASCRGWELNADWFAQVDAGQTVESAFNVFPGDLARCGLSQVDECRMQIQVQNYDSFTGELFADESVVFSPTGLDPAQLSPAPARTPGPEDSVLLDDERLTVSVCGGESDPSQPFMLVLYYQNKSGEDLAVSWQDVTVNGTDANFWLTKVLPAGLQGWTLICFDEQTLRNSGISSIDTVELTLAVKDPVTQEEFYSQSCSYQAINK